MEDKHLPILHSQYHGCWWHGDARSQGISNHDIDQVNIRSQDIKVMQTICIILGTSLLRYVIWGLWCQKEVSWAYISNYTPQYSVGCNYLCMPKIPASGAKVLMCTVHPGNVPSNWRRCDPHFQALMNDINYKYLLMFPLDTCSVYSFV